MDRIIITDQDEAFLKEVGQKLIDAGNVLEVNVSMAGNFELLLEQSQIIITFSQKNDDYLHAKVEALEKKSRSQLISFDYDYNLNPSNYIYNPVFLKNKQMKEYIEYLSVDVANILGLFFHVLNNYEDYQIIEQKEVVSQKLLSNKKKNKPAKKRTIRVINKVIRINQNDDVQKEVKKKAARKWHVDEFGRRGHWRKYKNGKRVWIAAQTVKTGAKTGIKSTKDYRL